MALLAVLLLFCVTAGGSVPFNRTPVLPPGEPGVTVTAIVSGRPFLLHLPRAYRAGGGMPLLVLLHGYTSSAAEAERYFAFTAESDRRGFLYAMPDGSRNARGDRFWNATDACCDFYRSGVDDSRYLLRLIDTVKSAYPVDAGRVFFVGHSNGGFMSYRMACDHPAAVAAIVSLAGAAPNDPAGCTPARPVNVLQIHGTADTTISFEGGSNAGKPYPSVANSLGLWRRLDGCSDEASPAAAMDLEASLPGAETTVTTYSTNCREGTRVELWSIAGGGHVPTLTDAFTPAIVDFLLTRAVRR